MFVKHNFYGRFFAKPLPPPGLHQQELAAAGGRE
jgi:hypothetical protein